MGQRVKLALLSGASEPAQWTSVMTVVVVAVVQGRNIVVGVEFVEEVWS